LIKSTHYRQYTTIQADIREKLKLYLIINPIANSLLLEILVSAQSALVVVDFVFFKMRAGENGMVFGWLVWSVVSCFVMGFFGGPCFSYGFGVYMLVLVEARGWFRFVASDDVFCAKAFLAVPVPTGAPSTARTLRDSECHVSKAGYRDEFQPVYVVS
jgi:hypothetical protein